MVMRKKNVFIIMVAILVLGILIIGRKGLLFRTEKTANQQTPLNKITVDVQKAVSSKMKLNMSYKGTIDPVDSGIVSSKIAGKVTQVLLENGKVVAKGDPLVLLDDQDIKNQLSAAQNQLVISEDNLQKAQTNLDMAQQNYTRNKALLDQGAISQASFDNIDAALKIAASDFNSAKAGIEAVKINIDTLNDQLANTIIRAPMDGVIDEKNVGVGQYLAVQGGSPILAKVKDISTVNAVIQVEQSDLNSIKIGQRASVLLNGGNGTSFEGIVKSIDPSASPIARTINCRIEVVNKDRSLLPGEFVQVSISGDQETNVILIPTGALMGSEGNYSVFVADNGTARKRQVTIGQINKNTVIIKSGINENESVICTNLNMLQDGDTIEAALKQEG